jgi:ABC-type multidrug transport system permease subunit
MIRKIFAIFLRDAKSNRRDFLSIYLIIVPVIFAILINMVTPSINDTTVNLALIEGENPAMVEYLEQYAKVSLYEDEEAIEERVNRRDEVFGVVSNGESYMIIEQGNETKGLVDFAKALVVFEDLGLDGSDSNSTIHSFGKTVPPLKQLLVIMALFFSVILGGMLISFNIIEEKVDRTVRAIHLSTVSRNMFVFGKSIMGVFLPIYGTVVIVIVTGFSEINWGMLALLILSSAIISMLVGFFQGIINDDVISAAASVKMLFLPLAAGPLAIELLAQKWHWLFYWNPFYWAYKGAKDIFAYQAEWGSILLYTGIILVISALVYLYLAPKIKKGLE